MFIHACHTHFIKLIVLLLLSVVYVKCDCTNKYVGRGEVTAAMIEDVKKAIGDYIEEHPRLNADSVRLEFIPLLATLNKLKKGEGTDISLEIVDDAARLGQPAVVQAFIDIMTRDVQDIKLQQELDASLKIAKMHAESNAAMKKGKEARCQAEIKKAQREEEQRRGKEKIEQEKIEQEIKKLKEESLQAMVKRRLAFEQAGELIKNGKDFITSYRISNVEDIKLYFEYVKDELANITANLPLPEHQQKDIKTILEDIETETQEITETLDNIKYGIAYPNNPQGIHYDPSHLQTAHKLLEDLNKYKGELRQLLAARGENLSEYEEEPEIETEEEQVAYRELEEDINDTSDTQKLVAIVQQEMQKMLDSIGGDDTKRNVLKQEAIQIATKGQELVILLMARCMAIERLYFNSDIKDYINRPINEGVQKIKMLHETSDSLEKSLSHFCNQFIIPLPAVPHPSIITKKELKVAFRSLIDQLVPGSKLVKATLGTSPLPQTPEGWAELGVKAGFDFIPYGEELEVLVGKDKPTLQKKIKNLLVKLIKKRTEKAK